MPFSFSVTLACSVSLAGLVEEGRTWVWVSLASSAFLEIGSAWELGEVGGLDAQIAGGVIDVLYSPEGRRGLNPNPVEGLVPYLEAICLAYLRDLVLKCLIGLSHPHIVVVLFNLVLSLLGLFKLLF